MDFLNKYSLVIKNTILSLICAVKLTCAAQLILLVVAAILVPSPSMADENYDNYANFIQRLMNMIGNAEEKVFLRTEYLSDGNIVMALNLAKFRDVDVKVVVHKKKARYYMSRYSTLRKHNIPTVVSSGQWAHPSSIMVDDMLFEINTPLDYKTRTRYFRVSETNAEIAKTFERSFSSGLKFPTYHNSSVKKSPQKTTRNNGSSPNTWSRSSSKSHPSNSTAGNEDESVYTYSNKKKDAPEGIQTKLPRKTKWQLNRQ